MKFSIEYKAKFLILTDILFTLAPLIILFIIKINKESFESFLKAPDVSFVNMILFGQSLVRFVSGTTKTRKNVNWQLISLILTILIVLGLFPSAIILTLILLNPFSSDFIIWQWGIFIFALLANFIIGSVGQMFLDE